MNIPDNISDDEVRVTVDQYDQNVVATMRSTLTAYPTLVVPFGITLPSFIATPTATYDDRFQ